MAVTSKSTNRVAGFQGFSGKLPVGFQSVAYKKLQLRTELINRYPTLICTIVKEKYYSDGTYSINVRYSVANE